MKRILLGIALAAATLTVGIVMAQDGGKSLASTMDVFVFPSKGQDSSQQSKDEADCYNWAVQNSGSDPFDLMKQADQEKSDATQAEKEAEQNQQQAAQTGHGAGAGGAVRGAAAGALIGSLSGDVGKGAAIGAAAGGIHGRRRGAHANQQAQAQAEKEAEKTEEHHAEKQAATAEDLENFKKAFSVCLEAKDYMVKY